MIEWAYLAAVVLNVLVVVAAYVEGRRGRGQTADATQAMMEAAHRATVELLEDCIDNNNTTHQAARIVLDERRSVLDALRTADPAARHRLLLSQKDDPAGTTAPVGEAAGGDSPVDSAEAADVDLLG